MDSLVDQKFHIRSDEHLRPFIGADPPEPRPGATANVITDGHLKVWSFRDDYLVLDGSRYSTHNGNQVVVRSGVIQGTKWEFIVIQPGLWRIRRVEDDTYWTATGVEPKRDVILLPFEEGRSQLWRFIPILED